MEKWKIWWEGLNAFSMDYPAWPTEFRRHSKLKQFVIKSPFNVSQHSKWKPCDSWLNLKEGSWRAALFAHSLSVLKWFPPGAMPGLPSLPQILPCPSVSQCWAAGAARGAGRVQVTHQIPIPAAVGLQRESEQPSWVQERWDWGMPSQRQGRWAFPASPLVFLSAIPC